VSDVAFVSPPVGGATTMENLWWKFSKTQKNRPQSCAKKIRIVTIEIVIKSTRVMGICVTNPAGTALHCLRGDAFVSSFICTC